MIKVKITVENAEGVTPLTDLNATFTSPEEANEHTAKCFDRLCIDHQTKPTEESETVAYFGKTEGANRWLKIEKVIEEAPAPEPTQEPTPEPAPAPEPTPEPVV